MQGVINRRDIHFIISDEPLPWTDQDTIDYIGTHLHLSAGVLDNLNKDQNNYIDMVLKLKNNGESVVQKGTWKLYFFKYIFISTIFFVYLYTKWYACTI